MRLQGTYTLTYGLVFVLLVLTNTSIYFSYVVMPHIICQVKTWLIVMLIIVLKTILSVNPILNIWVKLALPLVKHIEKIGEGQK